MKIRNYFLEESAYRRGHKGSGGKTGEKTLLNEESSLEDDPDPIKMEATG
jgi:hypothetical protein